MCVIDGRLGTVRCIDRDDVTHRVLPFDGAWIVEGELNVDLFAPGSATIVDTYRHSEVITKCTVEDGFVHIEDLGGATVVLDARHELRVVSRAKPPLTP